MYYYLRKYEILNPHINEIVFFHFGKNKLHFKMMESTKLLQRSHSLLFKSNTKDRFLRFYLPNSKFIYYYKSIIETT